MNKYEAEKIVNAYGGAISKGAIKRKKWLPCSKAKIKQAYFIYIDAIIQDFGALPQETGEQLVMCFSMLNMFVDDDKADHLDSIKTKIDAKSLSMDNAKDKKKWHEYVEYQSGVERKDGTFTGGMMDGDLYDEINEFIGECYEKNNA